RVSRIDDDDIVLFLCSFNESKAIFRKDPDALIRKARRTVWKVNLTDFNHALIDLNEINSFDVFMLNELTYDTSVTAADDENFFTVSRNHVRDMGDDFVINKFILI